MNTVPLEIYLARGYLRATVPMQHFNRVSDLLNNTPGQFLNVTISGVGEHAITPRGSVVRLGDVHFVRPLESESRVTAQTEHRERLPQRLVLELGDWRLVGNVHLIDSIRWIDFMSSVNDRFVPLTSSVFYQPGSDEPHEAGFVLVNGRRISALYEDS